MGELEIFSLRIKELRQAFDMTQIEFSQHVGITQQTLSGYERGLMKPSLDIAKRIAEKCNISIDWLCGLSEKRNFNKSFQTYGDIVKVLFDLFDCSEILLGIDIDSDCPYLTFRSTMLNHFLREWNDATNVLNNTSINKKIAQVMYDSWKKDKLDKLNKIPINENNPFNESSQE